MYSEGKNSINNIQIDTKDNAALSNKYPNPKVFSPNIE